MLLTARPSSTLLLMPDTKRQARAIGARLLWPAVADADRCHHALASATALFRLTERARTRSAQLMIPIMRPSVTTGSNISTDEPA